MRRWSRIAFFGASILLAVSTLTLWVRSHLNAEYAYLRLHNFQGNTTEVNWWRLTSSAGGLRFEYKRVEFHDNRSRQRYAVKPSPEFGWVPYPEKDRIYPLLVPVTTVWGHLGFQFIRLSGAGTPDVVSTTQPYWFLFIVSILAFAPWLVGAIRRFRRRSRGLCMYCGYDVRMNAGRCSECGVRKGAKSILIRNVRLRLCLNLSLRDDFPRRAFPRVAVDLEGC
jgi:hypothetical protein